MIDEAYLFFKWVSLVPFTFITQNNDIVGQGQDITEELQFQKFKGNFPEIQF